ncbi:jg19209 [Pararge aegeria aegeria]|uniref:Jg19209 protein n=1 Tax=Pararge aegeria aegeria TaxID=348720 RepID=A0A8S4SRI4_9NEOP|nr:jg19209 [Pararge aegeria aegeria]
MASVAMFASTNNILYRTIVIILSRVGKVPIEKEKGSPNVDIDAGIFFTNGRNFQIVLVNRKLSDASVTAAGSLDCRQLHMQIHTRN